MKGQIARVLVEDYPFFHQSIFSYVIPEDLIDKISKGSLVLVPFGLSNQMRLGAVLDCTNETIEPLKQITEVISRESPFNDEVFNFLIWVSSYFFYPLSLLFSRAGIFPSKKQIRVEYHWTNDLLQDIQSFKQKELLQSYIEKHPNGFFEDLLLRKMKWKKTSTAFKKFKSSPHLKSSFHVSYPEDTNYITKQPFHGTMLLNGISMKDRWKWLCSYVLKENIDKILMIMPSRKIEAEAKMFFKNSPLEKKIDYSGKQGLLKVDQRYPLIYVEDSVHLAYSLDMPFSFPVEKVALTRSMEMSEAVILASYLPSIYSFFHLKKKHIHHFNTYNFSKNHAPDIKILSMNKEIHHHGFSEVPFSVQRWIEKYLQQNKKVFVLVNRKGYYNYILCRNCGYVLKCPHCQIVLSCATDQKHVYCRYCLHKTLMPDVCPECDHVALRYHSPGTQKIEENLLKRFFGKRILRIDRDSLNEKIKIDLFHGAFDMGVGTSMALDYLNFDNIDSCVWLSLDNMINFPSFSSEEEAMCLLGRVYEKLISNDLKKELLISTFSPQSEWFRSIKSKTIGRYYEAMLDQREAFGYPPWHDWVQLIIESSDEKLLNDQISILKKLIQEKENIELKSVKKIVPQKGRQNKAFIILVNSPKIIESLPFLSSIIDEYKKNEKICFNIKALD